MCPSLFIQVENIPVNANGKKDQQAVDKIPISKEDIIGRPAKDDDAIRLTTLEQQVRSIWQEVLPAQSIAGLETMQCHSDFFRVGGNSLLAIQLRSQLRKCFGVDISLPGLFERNTLSSSLVLQADSPDHHPAQAEVVIK